MNKEWCKNMINRVPKVNETNKNKYGAVALAVLGSMVSINIAFDDTEEITPPAFIESQRATAKSNVAFNARQFQHKFQHYKDKTIITEVDYSINQKCASGDGWGGATLVNPNGSTAARIMCSTISTTIGCLVKSEFDKIKYSIQEGVCNTSLANPLVPLTN